MEIGVPVSALVGFTLALARTSAWVVVCPPFNSPTIPIRVRVGLATAISFVLAGTIADAAGPGLVSLEVGSFVLSLLAQVLAGLALGFAVQLLFAAVQAAGTLVDMQVGFSLGEVLDPFSGASAAPIGRFHQLLGLAILFAVDGHVLVVRGFLRSVETAPLGRVDLEELAVGLTGLLSTFFRAAVEIGLPVLAALFCTEVALGLLGKAAPQLNILIIGFAAKTAVALVLLGMTLVMLPEATESLLVRSIRSVAGAFGA